MAIRSHYFLIRLPKLITLHELCRRVEMYFNVLKWARHFHKTSHLMARSLPMFFAYVFFKHHVLCRRFWTELILLRWLVLSCNLINVYNVVDVHTSFKLRGDCMLGCSHNNTEVTTADACAACTSEPSPLVSCYMHSKLTGVAHMAIPLAEVLLAPLFVCLMHLYA